MLTATHGITALCGNTSALPYRLDVPRPRSQGALPKVSADSRMDRIHAARRGAAIMGALGHPELDKLAAKVGAVLRMAGGAHTGGLADGGQSSTCTLTCVRSAWPHARLCPQEEQDKKKRKQRLLQLGKQAQAQGGRRPSHAAGFE
jgi:hypothetical protein